MSIGFLTCPDICPSGSGQKVQKPPLYLQAGQRAEPDRAYAAPYEAGNIKTPTKKVYPPGAPPRYLPQPTETTSGDFLTMGPIGPWAAGHLDWTPHAGSTGVRPIVDKYSITRYSTGQWRENNQKTLRPAAVKECIEVKEVIDKDLERAFGIITNANNKSNDELKARIEALKKAKKAAQNAVDSITNELNTLEEDRAKLKGASRILMLPEAISRECLEIRTHRYEPDLVRDDAEQELLTEVALIGEIRRVFNETLAKVEVQLEENRAAKALIESDWSDKMVTLKQDQVNYSMDRNSNILLYHHGVDRWPENSCTLEYWKHFCTESIRNCEEIRQKSENLRSDLWNSVIKGGQDLKTQSERTNLALAETVSVTQELCDKLEETLKENLQRTAETENLIEHLHDSLRKAEESKKNAMTRLHSRNYSRQNVENCRDEAQYALMDECKLLKETIESLKKHFRKANEVRADLMRNRGALEKDIASKRKALLIDGDRCTRLRKFFPTPEELAAGS